MRRSAFTLAAKAKIAVLLSGCGVFDGSEIHESTSALIHLDRHGASYQCFAPALQQFHVVNHQTGSATESDRYMHEEAARIARGPVRDVVEFAAGQSVAEAAIRTEKFDALVIPGGFGVMKNLSNFAVAPIGERAMVPEVAAMLKAFHALNKPIMAACIAPMLLANVFPLCTVTLGSTVGSAQDLAREWRAVLIDKSDGTVCVDKENKFVTVPAYMLDGATPHEVFTGIGAAIDTIISMIIVEQQQ